MSKRSRATYEADLQAQQSPFVAYGTPLPPLDPEVRDDGSFVPVRCLMFYNFLKILTNNIRKIWKQQVLDDQGRRRLHGAFTGGFSAG